jgi:hypothetical protein
VGAKAQNIDHRLTEYHPIRPSQHTEMDYLGFKEQRGIDYLALVQREREREKGKEKKESSIPAALVRRSHLPVSLPISI